MKLGEIITSIEFSDSEKDRIGVAVLSGKGLIYDALTKKIHSVQSHDFWRSAHKRFRIKGFREGHPSAKNIVLKKAIESLKLRPGHENQDIWALYRNCAIQYVIDELSNLNRLLLNEDFSPSEGALAEQIFKCIKERMPLYSAGADQVEQLYEIWGFDRISNFKSIFENENLNVEIVRRMIESETGRIKREIGGSVTEISTELQQVSRENTKAIELLKEEVEDLEKKIDSSVAILRTEFQNLAASVMQKKAHEIKESLLKLTKKIKPESVQKTNYDPEALVALQDRINKIAKKVQFHDKALSNQIEVGSAGGYSASTSVGTVVPNAVYEAAVSICKKHGVKSPTLGMPWVLVKILQKGRIIITDRPNLLVEILSCILKCERRQISALPTWITPSDWEDSIKFIKDNTTPRVLILSDFDVAIQESYLAPVLSELFDNSEMNTFSRVILVPSKPMPSSVSNRVLEMSINMDFEANWVNLTNNVPEEVIKKCQSTVAVGTRDLLGHSLNPNIEFERDLKRIVQNRGIVLPTRLATQFMSIYTSLSRDLAELEAGAIALEVTILPWLRTARGTSVALLAEESLKIAFAGG